MLAVAGYSAYGLYGDLALASKQAIKPVTVRCALPFCKLRRELCLDWPFTDEAKKVLENQITICIYNAI